MTSSCRFCKAPGPWQRSRLILGVVPLLQPEYDQKIVGRLKSAGNGGPQLRLVSTKPAEDRFCESESSPLHHRELGAPRFRFHVTGNLIRIKQAEFVECTRLP